MKVKYAVVVDGVLLIEFEDGHVAEHQSIRCKPEELIGLEGAEMLRVLYDLKFKSGA